MLFFTKKCWRFVKPGVGIVILIVGLATILIASQQGLSSKKNEKALSLSLSRTVDDINSNTKTLEMDIEKIANLLSGKLPVRWIFTGDSITHGGLHLAGWRDYVQLFEERVRWELGPMLHLLPVLV